MPWRALFASEFVLGENRTEGDRITVASFTVTQGAVDESTGDPVSLRMFVDSSGNPEHYLMWHGVSQRKGMCSSFKLDFWS